MMTLGVEQLPGVMRLLRWLSAGWMEIMGWPIMVAPAPLLPVRLMTGGEAAVTEVWLISSGVMYWDRGRISLGASFTPAASGDCVWGVDADTDGMTPGDWTFCTTGDCTFWKEGDCPFCTAGDPTEDIPSPAKAFTAEALALALARIMLRSLGLFLDPLGRPLFGRNEGVNVLDDEVLLRFGGTSAPFLPRYSLVHGLGRPQSELGPQLGVVLFLPSCAGLHLRGGVRLEEGRVAAPPRHGQLLLGLVMVKLQLAASA